MRVYLTEKHSQQKAVAQAIGTTGGQGPLKGCIPVVDGVVATASGHIVRTRMPGDIRPEWKPFDLEQLPILPKGKEWRKVPEEKQRALVSNVVAALKAADEIVICTDAGREGELIARELIEQAGVESTPVRRLWTSVMNQTGLKQALARLRDGSETEGMGTAAVLRERSDYLEGMNYSRVATKHGNAGVSGPVSVGRAQTPALTMVVGREEEIEGWKEETYHTLAATATTGDGSSVELRHAPDPRVTAPAQASALADGARGWRGPLKVETARKQAGPPRPYELSTLQRDAERRWKWTAKKTLDVTQKLYEEHGAVSYPRTDGEAFDPTEWDTCMAALERLHAMGHAAAEHAPRSAEARRRDSVFNAAKLEGKDHHAIMPTGDAPDGLAGEEAQLFDLIARRFAAQFAGDWVYDQTVMAADAQGTVFRTSGKVTVDEGWRRIMGKAPPEPTKGKGTQEEDDESRTLPPIADGTEVALDPVEVKAHKTKPPKRLSESDLIQRLKKEKVGTKATWPALIEKLKQRQYVEVAEQKRLKPTARGRKLIEWIRGNCPKMATPEHTAALEQRLEDIEQGKASAEGMMERLEQEVGEGVRQMLAGPPLDLPPGPGARPQGRGGASAKASGAKMGQWGFRRDAEGAWGAEATLTGAAAKRLKKGDKIKVVLASGQKKDAVVQAKIREEPQADGTVRVRVKA